MPEIMDNSSEMTKEKSVHLIGCAVLAADLGRLAAELNLQLKTIFLPAGLHDKPKELRSRLQEAIDDAGRDEECSRIIVGYGICGRGTVGIRTSLVPLVLPRVHDCIALFLGSDQAYKREFAKYPGTFYLTAGWQLAKRNQGKSRDKAIWIGSETMGCNALRAQYGERGAERIIDFFTSWQKNYQRAAFIDTGLDPTGKYARQAREMADEHQWQYERIPGSSLLLRRLLTQEHSDDGILVVPPGHCTLYSALIDGLDCAPAVQTAEILPTGCRQPQLHKDQIGRKSSENLSSKSRFGLGIDAGGTYTDAVIYDFQDKRILFKSKALTTKWDFSIGIDNALAGLDQDLLAQVEIVSVSTTLATNAIVEGQGQKTGLIVMNNNGLAHSNTISHSPKRTVQGYIDIGGQERVAIDEREVRNAVREMIGEGASAFAVSGFAGAVNPIHELQVKEIIIQETGLIACCGHELSDLLDFTVRAQTAVLNARIIPLMIRFFREIDTILKRRSISAPVMVVKGDGTLMSAEMAKERPVETILSGPAASVAGAQLLTNLSEAIVVDMGGTTSDIAEIRNGSVAVCGRGARVGGFHTHVKALDMRTVGLGGDSFIRWSQGEFAIGPRRVVPLVYAGTLDPSGVLQALSRMDHDTFFRQEQALYLTMARPKFSFQPTPRELRILDLLSNRPCTPEELAADLGLVSARFLQLDRLEESGFIQKCGLTPTDVLHIKGSCRMWDPEPAGKLLEILSDHCKRPVGGLVEDLIGKVEKSLTLELVRHLVLKDVKNGGREDSGAGEGGEAALSPVARHLIGCLLEPARSSRYSVRADFHIPVIGVGAPVGYFLSGAQKVLNTEVVIPSDGDVANALGAITSHIAIHQKLVVRPDGMGEFVVEGVVGARRFTDLSEAQDWAVEYLQESVRSQGGKAGTSNKDVRVAIDDHVVNTAHGCPLFLERVITAELTGSPDLARQRC